ncbi:Transmembrane protease serine 6 [Araneus ventricosus]|uniref:Transmembrane protease serine 6 n=1 Tax=Araneus ventricosus TaxID=182803 RepID=A0A4Y2KF72_ARAVE|nr:Transmembrane protease serine 6 [Araneus ventricosus]
MITNIEVFYTDCGRANEMTSKIVGGAVVNAHKYPWMVTVHADNGLCGGALITRQYVLTAAHCVTNKRNIGVGIAVHDRNRPGQIIPASVVKIHPEYRETEHYDIALIKLQGAVIISERVRTLCLPHNLNLEQAGKHAIAAGWGMTQPGNPNSDSKFLKEVNLKILNAERIITAQGVNLTGACMATGSLFLEVVSDSHVNREGRGGLMGDSGSPLFTRYADGKYHVIGVTATTLKRPRPCMGVSNYARVSVHTQWIMNNIMDSVPCEMANDEMAPVATNHL